MTETTLSPAPAWLKIAQDAQAEHDLISLQNKAKQAHRKHHGMVENLTEKPEHVTWLRATLEGLGIPAKFGRYGKCGMAHCDGYLFKTYTQQLQSGTRWVLVVGKVTPRALRARADVVNAAHLSDWIHLYPITWVSQESVVGSASFKPWMLVPLLERLDASLADAEKEIGEREKRMAEFWAQQAQEDQPLPTPEVPELPIADQWLVAQLKSLTNHLNMGITLNSGEQAIIGLARFVFAVQDRFTDLENN